MTLLHIDGFDLGDFATRYTTSTGASSGSGATNTRFNSGRSIATGSFSPVTKPLTASATIISGVAIRCGTSDMTIGFNADTGAVNHVTVVLTTTGTLNVYRGPGAGILLGTVAGAFSSSSWVFVEMKVTVSDTVGVIEVRLNGSTSPTINVTGADTRNAGTSTNIDQMTLNHNGGSGHYDDWYILNTLGSAPVNTFLGDCRVHTLSPSGNGTSSQFVGSDADSVNNYLLVNEQPFDTANYVGSATVNNKDTYAMTDLAGTVVTVFATQEVAYAAKSDAGAATIKTVVRSGATDYASSAGTLATSYAPFVNLREVDPATTAAWTTSGVNAAEVGVQVG